MALPVQRRSRTAPAQRDNPFREFEDLQDRMTQLMQNVWTGLGDGESALWSPPVDVEENDDAWVIEADLPGALHDDINVEVHDNELVITGEIKERERKGILRRRTRRTGEFEYRVTLPGDVDADNVDARLEGGVLTVRVPKSERERARHVEVQGS